MNNEKINQEVNIKVDSVVLKGILTIPLNPIGLVVFAHGSGSSHLSPRNNYVASVLQENHLATLLFDLLTEDEDETYENRFNLELITDRLVMATEWAEKQEKLKDLPFGYFGASTGTPAALRAAIRLEDKIKAIVSRSGRPDLIGSEIAIVKQPVLFIVGGQDTVVKDLNTQSYDMIPGTKLILEIRGANHLFEEPGTLEQAAKAASDWFEQYLCP